MERWKTIEKFEEYEVSNKGRIRRVIMAKNNHKGKKELSQQTSKKGYKKVYLYKDGLKHCFSVHSLVLTTFNKPRPDKLQANHIDGNKANNSIENLEWVTASQNVLHSVENNLRNQHGSSVGSCILTEETVLKIVKMKKNGYGSGEISRELKVKKPTVQCILSGRTWGWLTGIEFGTSYR